jgi:hypothetical protein
LCGGDHTFAWRNKVGGLGIHAHFSSAFVLSH